MALVSFNGDAMRHDIALLRREFAALPEGLFRRQLRSVLRKTAQPLLPQFKVSAPRKTGGLRRSARVVVGKGKNLYARVGFGAKGGAAALLINEGTADRYTRAGHFRGKIKGTGFADGALASARSAGGNLVPQIKTALDAGLRQRAAWLAAKQRARGKR